MGGADLGALEGPLGPGLPNAEDSREVCAPPPAWLWASAGSSLSICPHPRPPRAQPDSLLSPGPTRGPGLSEARAGSVDGPLPPLGKELVLNTLAKSPHQTKTQ